MKNIFLILFTCCFSFLQAQTYEGKIGKYPIFLELDKDYRDGRVTAFYFYKNQLDNIPLDGTNSDSEITLFQQYSKEEEKKELFSLTLNGNTLNGTWQNGDKTLQVELIQTNENLEALKRKNLSFVRDSVATYNQKELVWFTEKYSKKQLFRLGNGFTKAEREFMNPILDSIHLEYAMIGLDCSWADMYISVELVSDEYISFTEQSSIYCGGAHPSHNKVGHNFDLKNLVQLKSLTDYKPQLDYYQLIKSKYEDDTDLQDECEYFGGDEFMWKYCSWVLTDEGVVITPSFPHAMTPCEEGFFLTYEELE